MDKDKNLAAASCGTALVPEAGIESWPTAFAILGCLGFLG